MSVCHRCERVRKPNAAWLTVRQYGFYAKSWEFCCIECLGSHFEVPTLDRVKEDAAFAKAARSGDAAAGDEE